MYHQLRYNHTEESKSLDNLCLNFGSPLKYQATGTGHPSSSNYTTNTCYTQHTTNTCYTQHTCTATGKSKCTIKTWERKRHLLTNTQQNSFDSAHAGFSSSVDNLCIASASENPPTGHKKNSQQLSLHAVLALSHPAHGFWHAGAPVELQPQFNTASTVRNFC